ncbi:predicted protein [Naegleria gruberi]|uniref:Predicted protein n=1 Tax=Naegleria gruberi TaxID=5762 RepID=D2VN12_NAEGR|nr:uncharacterized protein NAEGRDRAFT_70334 [Naegleria gruberi]EFC41839.1 predicted protein [Naegleria gruberi]|eukprot:XP_002674583.1 predicted protein [Naegleria gruberi strain NEG-M]
MQDDDCCVLNLDFSIASQLLKNSFKQCYKNSTIIMDIGSCEAKIGFSQNPADPIIFPSVYGNARYKFSLMSIFNDVEVGERALQRKGVLSLRYPMMANGRTSDWVGVQRIYDHSFELLELVDVDERFMVLLSENNATGNQSNVVEERKQKAEYLFEKEAVMKIGMINQTIMTLVSYGLYTGTVLHSGNIQSLAMCIENCKLVSEMESCVHNQLLEIGGHQMTLDLEDLFRRNGITLGHHTNTICTEVKETLCRVKIPTRTVQDRKFELPDGSDLMIEGEWLEQITEKLFHSGSYCVESLITNAKATLLQEYCVGRWKLSISRI